MQIFKVSNSYDKEKYKIELFEATRIGHKSVYYMHNGKERRGAKESSYEAYFETQPQAHQYIVDKLNEDKARCKREKDYADSELNKATIALQNAIEKYKMQPTGKLKVTFS